MLVKGAALRDEVFVKNVTLIGEKGRGERQNRIKGLLFAFNGA